MRCEEEYAYAAEALIKIGRASITPDGGAHETKLSIRYWSTDVRDEIGNKWAVKPLIQMTGNNDTIIKRCAIESLGAWR